MNHSVQWRRQVTESEKYKINQRNATPLVNFLFEVDDSFTLYVLPFVTPSSVSHYEGQYIQMK